MRSVLDQYRRAYNTLDANAVAGVWPSVNTPSLARAFSQLESQRFIFNDCRIEVSGGRAHASCSGSASYVPKVGGRNMRTVDREWAFLLEKMSDGWVIRRADTR